MKLLNFWYSRFFNFSIFEIVNLILIFCFFFCFNLSISENLKIWNSQFNSHFFLNSQFFKFSIFNFLKFSIFENSVVRHFLMIFKHSDISEVVKKKAKMQLVPMILLTQLLIVWTKSLVSLCCHCRGSFEYYNDNGHFTIFSITVIHRHFTTKNPYAYGPKKNRKKTIMDFYMEKK